MIRTESGSGLGVGFRKYLNVCWNWNATMVILLITAGMQFGGLALPYLNLGSGCITAYK
jgi:hypothetical protein